MSLASRTLAITGLAAACLATGAPAAGAMGPCEATRTGIGTGFTETVVVTGVHAPAGANDVELTCGVVENGFTVARFTDDLIGPVAAVAGAVNLSAGPLSACYEATVYYVDGRVSHYDGCP